MELRVLAVAVVVGAWWLSTGVVLRLVWLPARTHARTFALSTVIGLAAMATVVIVRDDASVGGAYLGFVTGLVIWGWHELTFLLGIITGPRRQACPPGARGWARFRCASATVMHHEVALALTLALLGALGWGAENQVAGATFFVLWVMRLSAKLNLFLGVRNTTEEFVPDRLRYLLSYFRRASLNPLMPISLLGAGVGVALLGAATFESHATPFAVTAHTLLAVLLGLAAIEHVFLVIPLPDALLWRWIVPSDLPQTKPADLQKRKLT